MVPACAEFAPPGEQSSCGHRADLARHTEQEAVGNRVESLVPDGSTNGFGVDECFAKAHIGGQGNAFRNASKECISAFVDFGDPGEW